MVICEGRWHHGHHQELFIAYELQLLISVVMLIGWQAVLRYWYKRAIKRQERASECMQEDGERFDILFLISAQIGTKLQYIFSSLALLRVGVSSKFARIPLPRDHGSQLLRTSGVRANTNCSNFTCYRERLALTSNFFSSFRSTSYTALILPIWSVFQIPHSSNLNQWGYCSSKMMIRL